MCESERKLIEFRGRSNTSRPRSQLPLWREAQMASDDDYSYERGLTEFYRNEVIGEALYCGLLGAAQAPKERLKWAHLLQLETETKAWLRPHMILADVAIAEPQELAEAALHHVTSLVSLEWAGKMKAIVAFVPDLVKQYRAYVEAARSRGEIEQAAVCQFMVDHELAQAEFARLELGGADPATSLEPLMRQSRYPLPVGE
jgi:hypothetical protein